MRVFFSVFWVVLGAVFAAAPALAEDLTALARLDPAASRVANAGNGIAIDLAISQPVPYRVFLMADPARLVMDFSEVDFGAGKPKAIERAAGVTELGWGAIRPGWSRLVATLAGPYRVASAEEAVAGVADACAAPSAATKKPRSSRPASPTKAMSSGAAAAA